MEETRKPLQLGQARKRKHNEEVLPLSPLPCNTDDNINLGKETTLRETGVAIKRQLKPEHQLSDKSELIVKEGQVKEEMKETLSGHKEQDNGAGSTDKEEIDLDVTVVLDGQSVGHVGRNNKSAGTTEYKLLSALNYFQVLGHKVVIFFPNHMTQKLKPVSRAVMACIRLTMRKCTGFKTNPWALDRREVLQFAAARKALLVTNDSYKDFAFESEEVRDQLEHRLSGFTWSEDGFKPTQASEKQAAFPSLSSQSWKPQPAPQLTDRQMQILELEARQGSLVQYEKEKLINLRQLEALIHKQEY